MVRRSTKTDIRYTFRGFQGVSTAQRSVCSTIGKSEHLILLIHNQVFSNTSRDSFDYSVEVVNYNSEELVAGLQDRTLALTKSNLHS